MPNNPTIYYKRDVIFSYLYLGPKKWPLIRFKILSAILGRWVWLSTFVLFISSNNQTRWNHIKNQCSGQSVWLPTCCSPVGFPPSIQVLLSRGIITIFYLYLIFILFHSIFHYNFYSGTSLTWNYYYNQIATVISLHYQALSHFKLVSWFWFDYNAHYNDLIWL